MRVFDNDWYSELPEEIPPPPDDLVPPSEDGPTLRSERVQIEEPASDDAPIEEPAS
jgi:hypothetical protein